MTTFLFPSEPFAPRRVDPDFAREMAAIESLGLPAGLVNVDALQYDNDPVLAARHVPFDAGLTVYRGWMLTPGQYTNLYDALALRGTVLINTPEQYRHAHYLPDSYPAIASHTPRTVWLSTGGLPDFDVVADLLAPFGDAPVIVKDFVKSRKHEWAEACYIPSASDRAGVERVVRRFIELQSEDLAEGLVFREYVPLRGIGTHPKSGMPIAEEYRAFIVDGAPILTTEYWEDAEYAGEALSMDDFRTPLLAVDSRFFTADVARREDGSAMIVELGDGQVAGLPDHVDPTSFYEHLAETLRRGDTGGTN